MIYEGKFKDGKRWNGKGKEGKYILDLNFEEKYKDGKRWNGYWKEFKYGKLIFSGEYLNGKRNGTGKEYYYHGLLSFDGERKEKLRVFHLMENKCCSWVPLKNYYYLIINKLF